MKLRNIIASFLAVVAIAVGCTEELTGNLSSIQLDQSTIVLPEEGGSATITVTATSDWKVDAATVPAEVTITPMEGKAGETKMTISTVGSVNDINADIVILVGAQKQFIKFYQPGDPSMKPQFDEFTAGDYWIMCQEDGEWFALKSTGCTIDDSGSYNYLYSVPAVVAEDGSLSSTASNVFTFEAVEGGFIIKDPAGGYLYQVAKYNNFYLTSDKAQASVWAVNQISADEFMLEISDLSKWMQYSTSYDSAGAYANAQEGATLPKLVKAEAPAEDPFVIEQTEFELPLEAGELLIPVTYNGSDIHVAELPTWLTFYGYHDGNIKFTYEANEGGNRVANVLLTTCMEDGREAQVELVFAQEGAIVVVSVADFLAAPEGTALYELTGIVKNIANTTYGNFDLVDATGSVYVYGLTDNGAIGSNDKTFSSLGINEGDVITIIGTRTSYNETPQVGGTAYLKEHVVAAKSATVTEFLAESNGTWCKVTGTIANLVNETYGNFDLVGEDGASVYVYGLTTSYVTKNDKSFANLGLKEGDIVTLVGKRDSYNGEDQVGGPAYYLSHEAGAAVEYSLDGKQWTFAWQGMGGASCVIDFGVTEPGVAILAYDMGVLDPSYAGIYYPYMMGAYTIAKTDGTSGVVTLSADGQSVEIPYSNATENTVHFESAALLDGENIDCTLATSLIEISTGAAEGLADGEYWIIADGKVATPLTSSYGYLNVVDAVDGKSTAANAFTFTQVEAGLYTIQDSNGKYYYQTGTYNSFNVADTDGGTDEYLWEVYDSGNGTFVIMNYEVGKFMQYDSGYNSYGSYSDERGVLPALVLAEDPIAEPEPTPGDMAHALTSNLEWTLGNKAFSEKATINGNADVPVLKLGTSSVVGDATVVIPAGTTKVGFYGVAWNGKKGTITASTELAGGQFFSQDLVANAGAANNTPYTMTVTESDYYEIDVVKLLGSACPMDLTVTLSTVSGATRVILFGLNAYAE